jgi:hypothetical protein
MLQFLGDSCKAATHPKAATVFSLVSFFHSRNLHFSRLNLEAISS